MKTVIRATIDSLATLLRVRVDQAEEVLRSEPSARAALSRRGLFAAAGAVASGVAFGDVVPWIRNGVLRSFGDGASLHVYEPTELDGRYRNVFIYPPFGRVILAGRCHIDGMLMIMPDPAEPDLLKPPPSGVVTFARGGLTPA